MVRLACPWTAAESGAEVKMEKDVVVFSYGSHVYTVNVFSVPEKIVVVEAAASAAFLTSKILEQSLPLLPPSRAFSGSPAGP